ncbi:MAG TPA: ABC transporter ATP-binding protein [Syntrophomonas sp.]|nr:ABC transporter ATP-binding protein [Syntrophomonas sp.]HRW13074.1 ABC transporter ATP-binding protein [Syntrophomonas sp.]
MEYAISTRNLTRCFGDFVAVDNLTMDIIPGEICGFLGPNGAGKSTAIRMLCGILAPSSGSGTVLGYDLLQETEKIKPKIAYMSQKFSLYDDLTVIENLDFYTGIYSIPARQRRQRMFEMLELAELGGREKALVANLSSGYKQRLALAAAIIAGPELIFLDEPTSGVSPTSRRQFFEIIKQLAEKGTTVIVTTHFMDEAERCDRIAFINQGRLMALDAPDQLKQQFINGCMVSLTVPEPMDHLDKLSSLPYVQEASLHGSHLHVLLAQEEDIALLRQNCGYVPEQITPSLEDVFIHIARQRKEGGLTS